MSPAIQARLKQMEEYHRAITSPSHIATTPTTALNQQRFALLNNKLDLILELIINAIDPTFEQQLPTPDTESGYSGHSASAGFQDHAGITEQL